MLENDYDIFEDYSKVSIQFGVIDKEEKRADENQVIQLWTNNLCTHEEARMKLNMRALEEPELERTYYALFGELAALATSAVMPNAAAEALGESPISNISAESVKKEEKRAEEKSVLEKKAAVVAARPLLIQKRQLREDQPAGRTKLIVIKFALLTSTGKDLLLRQQKT